MLGILDSFMGYIHPVNRVRMRGIPTFSAHMRAWPSGKASAFQADIRGSESRRPL
jgi:hypothetical protein